MDKLLCFILNETVEQTMNYTNTHKNFLLHNGNEKHIFNRKRKLLQPEIPWKYKLEIYWQIDKLFSPEREREHRIKV